MRRAEADEIVDLLRRVMILAVQEAIESRMAEQRFAQRIPSRWQQEQDVGLPLSRSASVPTLHHDTS